MQCNDVKELNEKTITRAMSNCRKHCLVYKYGMYGRFLFCFVLNHFQFSNAGRKRVKELIGAKEGVYDHWKIVL